MNIILRMFFQFFVIYMNIMLFDGIWRNVYWVLVVNGLGLIYILVIKLYVCVRDTITITYPL